MSYLVVDSSRHTAVDQVEVLHNYKLADQEELHIVQDRYQEEEHHNQGVEHYNQDNHLD